MSEAALKPLAHETASVVARLQGLRRKIAAWFWIDGLSRVLWLALALAAADLALDWMFRMDRPQRMVMLTICVGLIGWLIYRRLVRPLSATMTDDALALQVEAANRQLGQSMITALQLSRMEDVESRGMSPVLVRQTIQKGAASAERVDFSGVLDGKEFRFNSLLLAVAAGLFVALGWGVTQNQALGIWFNRNVLLGDETWPQKTYLIVERAQDGRVVFPRGEDWTQLVTVTPESKVVPEAVYIDFRRARGRLAQAMKKTTERQFEAVFNNVIEPFEFRARGGDAVTPWVRVELVEQPAVESLRLEITPPAYTRQKPEVLPPGRGPYYVLAGSSLRITGTANKPLARAALLQEAKRLPLQLDKNINFAGSVAANDLIAGQYTIELEDMLGLTSRRPTTFGLRARLDREPRVRVRLIGVSGMVVPKARVPFTCRITDDFDVTQVETRYHWRGDDMTQPDGEGKIAFEQLQEKLPAKEISFNDVLELTPLKIPTGTGFNFHFAAEDNDDVSGPNLGKSSDLLLRVVTEEELRTDLLRREKEQRQEFERLLKNQEDLLTDCRALAAEIKSRGGQPPTGETAALSPQQKDLLMQYQKRQKLVGQNVGAIAERLASIVIEVQNNRLEEDGGKLQTRLTEDIVLPMRDVADTLVPQAVQLLDRTRRQSAEPAARDQSLADTINGQEQTVEKMQEILRHMVKSEGFQEAVNLLYEIQKAQQNVHEQTNKERQDRIKRILEGGEGGSPSNSQP